MNCSQLTMPRESGVVRGEVFSESSWLKHSRSTRYQLTEYLDFPTAMTCRVCLFIFICGPPLLFPLQVQLLTAEYVPMLSLLTLFIHIQASLTNTPVTATSHGLMVLATAGRYLFASKPFVPKGVQLLTGAIGATSTYVAFVGLLLSAASYAM